MKTFKITTCIFLLIVVSLVSGCATSKVSERDRSAARMAMDLADIRTDMERLKGKLDGVEKAQQYIDGRLSKLENGQQAYAKNLKTELDQLRKQVASLEGSRGKLKNDIIADISSKISKLMKVQASSAPSGDSGYEHIVKAGETLSVIAKAYGVKTSVILKANKISNPDILKVGAKLFIPQ